MAGVFSSLHGVATLQDQTGTPISVSLAPGEGNFSLSGLEEAGREAVAYQNRLTFQELLQGAEKEITGSITIAHEGTVTDAATNKPYDGMAKKGTFAAGVTADPGGLVWTTDIVFVTTRNAVAVTFTCNNCRVSMDYAEGAEGNLMTINFTAFGTGTGNQVVVT